MSASIKDLQAQLDELKAEQRKAQIETIKAEAKAKAQEAVVKSLETAYAAKTAAMHGLGKGLGWMLKATKSVRSEITDGIKSVQ